MATNTVTENVVFGYASGGDSPAYSKNLMTNVVSTYLGLVNYTGTTGSWPISNAHGDSVGVTDVNATFVVNAPTDEYGRGVAPADRVGWLGAHYRFNIGGTQNLTRMGVRLYDPNLGRFLQVDPIEGGSANDYDYTNADPCNSVDLDGRGPLSLIKPLSNGKKCFKAQQKLNAFVRRMLVWLETHNNRFMDGQLPNRVGAKNTAWLKKHVIIPSGYYHDTVDACGKASLELLKAGF